MALQTRVTNEYIYYDFVDGDHLAIGAEGENVKIETNVSGEVITNYLNFGDAKGTTINVNRLTRTGDRLDVGMGWEEIVGSELNDHYRYKKGFGVLDFIEPTALSTIIESGEDWTEAQYTAGALGHFTLSNPLTVPEMSITSDKRYKKNIEPLPDNILEKLSKLKGYSYNWKYNNDPQKTLGLIAQEVESEFPELIRETKHDEKELLDKEPKKVLNYMGLIPVLVDAINQLQQEVKELKALIN